MYQASKGWLYTNMFASTLSMPTADPTSGEGRHVRVEFRAATPEEIKQIDMSSSEIVLPAHVVMSHHQWRTALAPFPVGVPDAQIRCRRPPGSMIWAQLASRAGDMVVGGRDRFGMPSVPIPLHNGDICFVSAFPVDGADLQTGRKTGIPERDESIPLRRLASLFIEPDQCQPILSADGPIACASSDCRDCLCVLTRNSWNTSIACTCSARDDS